MNETDNYEDVGRRVSVIRTKITMEHAFWAVIVLHCGFILEPALVGRDGRLVLGATDCAKSIWLNPLLVRGLTDPKFLGLILHELLHIVFMHEGRRNGRDRELWNYACDYAVNSVIVDDMGYEIPDGGCYDIKYRGLSAEDIYDLLLEEEQQAASQQQQQQQGDPQIGEGAGDGQGDSDSQDQDGQDGSGQNPGKQQQPGKGKGKSAGKKPGKKQAGTGADGDQQADSNAPNSGTGKPGSKRGQFDSHLPMPSGSESEVKDMIATAQAVWESTPEAQRGILPGSMVDYIKKLLNPRVPWERELQKFVGNTLCKDDFSWSPPARRYLVHDIYMPSCKSHKVGNVVWAIDSSGSTHGKQQLIFASELAKFASIVDEVTVIVADSVVHQVVKTKDLPAFLKNIKFEGQGGTSHIPVFEKIKELRLEPELFIGLTDGYTDIPERKPRYPILWALTSENAELPWGKQIYIDVD